MHSATDEYLNFFQFLDVTGHTGVHSCAYVCFALCIDLEMDFLRLSVHMHTTQP